ncbi:MAG: NUDIX domain-containing protein [Oscillatoriales cyanobacterium]|nr:MAG: NUDIX domain-containing protein [Oscillatoriales cyanobacterium]
MKNLTKWKLLRSRLVLNHKWCQVRQDEIELPSGQIIDDFFINVRPNIALIFAVTEQQELVCVRAEESGKAAAARELAEETGYVAEEILELAVLYDNPVKDTNSIYLYLGKNVKLASQIKLDITEDIEVVLVPISEVLLKITNREICVAGSIAAIFLGLDFLNKH